MILIVDGCGHLVGSDAFALQCVDAVFELVHGRDIQAVRRRSYRLVSLFLIVLPSFETFVTWLCRALPASHTGRRMDCFSAVFDMQTLEKN